jgi:hypothetical protein
LIDAAPPPPIYCVDTGPRVVLVVGTPPDRESRFARPMRKAKRLRNETEDLFSRLSGYGIRWACGGPRRIPLTPISETEDGRYSREDAETDQARADLDGEDINLVLLYDGDPRDTHGSVSRIDNDSTPGLSNPNNVGPRTSLVVEWTRKVVLHELAHSWGAVQHDAPHEDDHRHCTDGRDVLCWWAPGPCRTITFDCRRDDYFNPDPEPGSYLDTHFNIATDSVWVQ